MTPKQFRTLVSIARRGESQSWAIGQVISDHREWVEAFVAARVTAGDHDGQIGKALSLSKAPIMKIRHRLNLNANLPPVPKLDVTAESVWQMPGGNIADRWTKRMGVMVNHGTDADPDWRCTVSLMETLVVKVVNPRRLPSRNVEGSYGSSAAMCADVGLRATGAFA